MDTDLITGKIVDSAFGIHKGLGPGLLEERVIVELKSVERLAPVHSRQVLTYLRLMKLEVGLLINFGESLFKDGVKRVVNNYIPSATSRLRVNQRD